MRCKNQSLPSAAGDRQQHTECAITRSVCVSRKGMATMGIEIGVLAVRRSVLIHTPPARVWEEFTSFERL